MPFVAQSMVFAFAGPAVVKPLTNRDRQAFVGMHAVVGDAGTITLWPMRQEHREARLLVSSSLDRRIGAATGGMSIPKASEIVPCP